MEKEVAFSHCREVCPPNPHATGSTKAKNSFAPLKILHTHTHACTHNLLFWMCSCIHRLPRWFSGKEPTCQCRRHRFDPWVRKSPWRRKWQPTLVFLPGKSVHTYDKHSFYNCQRMSNAFLKINVSVPEETRVRTHTRTPLVQKRIQGSLKSGSFHLQNKGLGMKGDG